MRDEFAARLRELRIEKGIRQMDAACGIALLSDRKYGEWERGDSRPSYEYLCRLANYYGVTIDYLLGRTEARDSGEALLLSDLGLTQDGAKKLKELIWQGKNYHGLVRAIWRALDAICAVEGE